MTGGDRVFFRSCSLRPTGPGIYGKSTIGCGIKVHTDLEQASDRQPERRDYLSVMPCATAASGLEPGMRFSLPRLIALCLLVPLVGCGLFVSKETRALRRMPQYRDGYNDGCQSAQPQDANMREAAPLMRDDQLY